MHRHLSEYDHFQFVKSWTIFCFLMKASFKKKGLYCHSFLPTWYKSRCTKEEGVSIEYLPPSDWPVGVAVECFLGCWLIWEGSVHCRWCFLTQGVGLVFYPWQVRENKPGNCVPPRFLFHTPTWCSCLGFPGWWAVICEPIKLFPLRCC